MSRVAYDANRLTFGGASQIPRALKANQTIQMQNRDQVTKPSRLEQLQAGFQQRRMQEKEEKLVQLYEDNQMRALQKVNKNSGKSVLRDFFEERRAARGQDKNAPSLDHMLKQKKLEQMAGDNRFGINGSVHQSEIQSKYSKNKFGQPAKTSAGRDRSNLLAPIKRPEHQDDVPFPNKPQMVRPRTFGNQSSSGINRDNFELVPRSAPTGAYETTDESLSDDTPPPNFQNLKNLHQKRALLQSQRSNRSIASTCSTQSKPLGDFQKWQKDQDRSREERLKKYRETSLPPPEDEGYEEEDDSMVDPNDDIKRKQLELLAQIEAQQEELNRLKKQRLKEEQREAKEKEKRRKHEEERKRRMKEEEEKRIKEEDEERVKRQWEEEKLRKVQEEKKRFRVTSNRYDDGEEDMEDDRHTRRSNRSTARKQQSSRKEPQPKPKRAPPTTQTSYNPGSEHTAFYDQAIKNEDAYQNENINLVSCFNCGRQFAEDRIEKHEKFCKNLTKKRKVMDPTKTRIRGTELEQYQSHKSPEPKPKKSNWRSQHESFIQSIRYAKKVTQIENSGGNLADLPPPPPAENPDYVQCPHCSRKFNPGTAERHIPHCKNTKARPAPPKRR